MPPIVPPGQQPFTVQRDLLQAQKELLSEGFQRANAYTNLILGAGYAGFFAVWAFTRAELSTALIFWSAILVTISLLTFVSFEVFRTLYNGIAMLELSRAVEDEANFAIHLAAWKRKQQTRNIWLGNIWLPAFTMSAVSGFGGALILGYAFIRGLIRLYFNW